MGSKGSNVKGKLSRVDLISMAVGQIIGVGVMTMTGIAIGFTGRSVNIAYLIAAAISLLGSIPQIFIGGTANFKGGQYTQVAVLLGKKISGIYMYITMFMCIAISMYAISFSEYLLSLAPNINVTLVSVLILIVLFSMNLVGVKEAAVVQNLMVIVLAASLALYIVLGIPNIDKAYFSTDFLTKGTGGLILASVYLTFAVGGANYIVNFSNDAKNPTKDIPFAIVVATLGVVIIYALMSTVAAGVLPVAEVANQPLSVSAKAFMPGPVATFFIIGGAMFALLTTMNFSIGMMVNPMAMAAKDGWLPEFFTRKNKKFGTYHNVLLILFAAGVIPILTGFDISEIANSTVILTTSLRGVIALAAIFLPKKLPELWEKSSLHVSNGMLKATSILGILLAGVSVVMLIVTGTKKQMIINVIILAICVIFGFVRSKKVELEAEYK